MGRDPKSAKRIQAPKVRTIRIPAKVDIRQSAGTFECLLIQEDGCLTSSNTLGIFLLITGRGLVKRGAVYLDLDIMIHII